MESPYNEITSLYEEISHYCDERALERPNIIVMNYTFFKRWYEWCLEKDQDFKTWEGLTIALKPENPFELTLTWR